MSVNGDLNRARKVFVVHGRDGAARSAMFSFLRAIGLDPIEWSEAVSMTGEGSPYIGRVLDVAFDAAQAIVVLLTPDDIAYLRQEFAAGDEDPETDPMPQARPNVLFEAGMAMGRDQSRTVLVELGKLRPFSDVGGRHAVRMDSSPQKRKDLAQRLKNAGCAVKLDGDDWMIVGDFSPPAPPGGGLPLGKRLPAAGPRRGVRLDARYHDRSNGGRLEILNQGAEDIYNLGVEVPEDINGLRIADHSLPVPRLPSGKSVTLPLMLTMNAPDYMNLTITGRTAGGDQVREESFVSLLG